MSSSDCLPFSLASLDCGNSTGWCLRAYGDVSGYGVIVGFKGTGYYVVLLLMAYYVIAFDPRRNPSELEGTQPAPPTSWEPNPIDIVVLDFIRRGRISRWMRKHRKGFGNCLVISILQLCDIQAFTGIAILISGFISLSTGISAYHWQIIAFLAWFSSITHLSGLTVLRSHPSNHQRNTTVRVVLMFVLLALLVVATVPTGYFSWADNEFQGYPLDEKHRFMSSPAICYLNLNPSIWDLWGLATTGSSVTEAGSFQSMVVSEFLLLTGFFTRAVKMSRRLSQRITRSIRHPISRYSQRLLIKISSHYEKHNQRGGRRQCIWHVVIAQPCLALFISARMIADSYSSLFSEVIWVLVAVLWGSLKIIDATKQLPQEIFEQENDWTFGQIVPLLLLSVPIFGTIVHLASNRTAPDPWEEHDDHDRLGAGATGTCKPYPFTTQRAELPEILTRAYSTRVRWLWPSLVGLFFSTAYFTYEAFSHNFGIAQGMIPYGSLVEVWFTRCGLFWYTVFGLPCILSNTVAIGLALDAWMERQGKLMTQAKVSFYLFLVVLLALANAGLWLLFVYFGFQSDLFKDLHMTENVVGRILRHIITCVLTDILSYVFYLFVAFPAQVWGQIGVRQSIC